MIKGQFQGKVKENIILHKKLYRKVCNNSFSRDFDWIIQVVYYFGKWRQRGAEVRPLPHAK